MEIKITHRGFSIEYIDTVDKLKTCVLYLQTVNTIAFDLEFDKNSFVYGFNLCLVQIATDKRCFVIDPLKLGNKALVTVFDLFENPKIIKILHSGSEDLRLLQLLGCRLKNLFDTDIAVKILNYEKISLGNVIKAKFDIDLDKSLQKSNWNLRPLSVEQIIYSASDVLFLIQLRKILEAELKECNRFEWFQEEVDYITTLHYNQEDKTDFLSGADKKNLTEFDQFVLNELLKFRDSLAKKLNRPAHHVMASSIVYSVLNDDTYLNNWLNVKGYFNSLRTADFQATFLNTRNAIVAKAEVLKLPKSKEQFFFTPEERDEFYRQKQEKIRIKDECFSPIQDLIAQKYGDFVAKHILSNVLANDIIAGYSKISTIPLKYKRDVILEKAQSLKINLEAYI